MKKLRLLTALFSTMAMCLFMAGCAHLSALPGNPPTHQTSGAVEQVDIALARFSRAILRMDSTTIAAQFTENGSMAHQGQQPIVGRAAIKSFLDSFAKFKVLQYDIKATSTSVQYRHATQEGQYSQVVVTPNGNTVHVNGVFAAKWELNSEGVWQISSMRTGPAPEAPAPSH